MMDCIQDFLISVYPLHGPDTPLTYAVPSQWKEDIHLGTLVRVPLGYRSTLAVVARKNLTKEDCPPKIKFILEVLYKTPMLSVDILKLLPWMRSYYASTLSAALEAALPSALRDEVKNKEQIWVNLTKKLTEEEKNSFKKRAAKQYALLEVLENHSKELEKQVLMDLSKASQSSYKALLDKGILQERKQVIERKAYADSLMDAELQSAFSDFKLNSEQTMAAQDIEQSIEAAQFQVHLLHGVTGSGKTEVYLHAAKKALSLDGSVLFLVPEVALTPQTLARLRARLDAEGIKTVLWHSQLSQGERSDAWLAIARGEARVVLGARSAIFAPLQNLKLIIVDEEHDSAYKQDETPRYQGRDLAVYRSKIAKAVCILGSATPSLESLHNVEVKGYKLNRLTQRVDARELPPMHIVDMRYERTLDKGQPLISRFLLDKLRQRLEAKEQTILFLNRRGYAPRVTCQACGHVLSCNHCSLTLTFHRPDKTLRCHLCNYQTFLPSSCPQCQQKNFHQIGAGTQRIEDILPKLLPKVRMARLDADTLNRKHAFRQILADFRKGKIDILIGTQMIAKGLDFPNVTLVGLIDADLSLHMPDFRASERTFQLLVQVAGRAGRGDRAGEVVVQTHTPASAPLQFARRADFEGFWAAEMEERRTFAYPPFRHLIRHVFRARNQDKVALLSEAWAKFLEKELGGQIELRGPAVAPREKIQDFYRYHLWYFTTNVSRTLSLILSTREKFKLDKDVIDVLDVDPSDLS